MQIRTLSLTACLALSLSACTVHVRHEYRSGTRGTSSAGSEVQSPPAAQEVRPEGRRSPHGRDTSVRVTRGSAPADKSTGANEPTRTVVRPSGDAPAGSSPSGAASGAASGTGTSDRPSSGSAATPVQNGDPSAYIPPRPEDSAPKDEPAAEEPASTRKETRKNPSEPHVATPTRKPRKSGREPEGAGGGKEGRR